MPNQIDGKKKEERSNKLIKLSKENEKKFLSKYIGKEVEVLFEQENEEYTKGHTSNYIIVNTKEKNIENEIKKVKISFEDNLELIAQ